MIKESIPTNAVESVQSGDAIGEEDVNVVHQIADDLSLLAWVHDRELDSAAIDALASTPAEDWFFMPPSGVVASTGFRLLNEACSSFRTQPRKELIEEQAADFAGLYLTHAHRTSPNESVWITEDGLLNQEPMFSVRDWYRRYELAVPDWRIRSDDHLVNQIVFLAELLRLDTPDSLPDAGRFLDQHLLTWIESFSDGAVSHCHTSFYAGLALVTHAYLEKFRLLIIELTGEKRKKPEVVIPIVPVEEPSSPAAYMPGVQKSW